MAINRKIFAFTGFLNSDRLTTQNEVIAKGGKVQKYISKQVDYLVAGTEPGSRLVKAKEIGITILTEQEFLKILN